MPGLSVSIQHDDGPCSCAAVIKRFGAISQARGLCFALFHDMNPRWWVAVGGSARTQKTNPKLGPLLTHVSPLPPAPSLPQVADFNLSRTVESNSTASTIVMTNPRWLAPEVLSGKPGQLSADVWAFGTVSCLKARHMHMREKDGHAIGRTLAQLSCCLCSPARGPPPHLARPQTHSAAVPHATTLQVLWELLSWELPFTNTNFFQVPACCLPALLVGWLGLAGQTASKCLGNSSRCLPACSVLAAPLHAEACCLRGGTRACCGLLGWCLLPAWS